MTYLQEIAHSYYHAHLMLEQGHTHTARAILDEMEISFNTLNERPAVRYSRRTSDLLPEATDLLEGSNPSSFTNLDSNRPRGGYDCVPQETNAAGSSPAESTLLPVSALASMAGIAPNCDCPSESSTTGLRHLHYELIED